jgi:hypothetical protein
MAELGSWLNGDAGRLHSLPLIACRMRQLALVIEHRAQSDISRQACTRGTGIYLSQGHCGAFASESARWKTRELGSVANKFDKRRKNVNGRLRRGKEDKSKSS